MEISLKKIIKAFRIATGTDIISELKAEFKKISTLDEDSIVALYYTLMSLENENSDSQLLHLIQTLKKATINRMLTMVRHEEGVLKMNQFSTYSGESEQAKAMKKLLNAPHETRIREMRTKFYEATQDGSLVEF